MLEKKALDVRIKVDLINVVIAQEFIVVLAAENLSYQNKKNLK